MPKSLRGACGLLPLVAALECNVPPSQLFSLVEDGEREQETIYSSSVLRAEKYTISLPISPFILIPVASLVLLFF